ncbi:probable phosphorylase b kinase regulatory subunit beta isoform X1 [Ischnura elegans]|uniref:probable phosphorylase b kinase regulatory subunit beta isoform X1 n=1 Tax=Ischnura elegans TaxID=197161 RepID=UPI001ED86CA5|nr:probable phosphorylase b kinase regulatory subunit beta isoform X1 [Ischnura elegans]
MMSLRTERHGSVGDIDVDPHLKITRKYEETVRKLDGHYGLVKRQLLRYQSSITGLFPVLSTDEHVGSVRESIYCAAAVWSLHQAYRRIDDDRGKSYELGQSAVKCMRGILECWEKQAGRVEAFKANQCSKHALHSKFHLYSGEVVYSDDEYPHLQIDVVSLYLIFLVQMITSGLQIVYTQDEVAFVQNLVYYVERAYRTPDYGMWERGSKYNDGSPEIHASSIGMAKSALEAINGCNLFGEKGASWSVVYVDIDAHNRNRSIFETMLPRESSSKDVDVSLIPTVSFPCFSTHDECLGNNTKENIIQKLRGSHGFKRFCRDGFMSPKEDPTRRYYRDGETKEFENIECEWPLFYIFMIIDGVFKSVPKQVEEYQSLLNARLKKDSYGDPCVPMCYTLPLDSVEAEKKEPGSQRKVPCFGRGWYDNMGGSSQRIEVYIENQKTDDEEDEEEESCSVLFLWSQAMYVIAQLLTDKLLHVNELDPVRRHLPSFNRPRKGGRYSAFQAKTMAGSTATDLVVQIVLMAESMRLQAVMATYGIQTQTPHQIEPVQVWSSTELVRVYQRLGVDKKLGLTGRPPRPIGALGTSKVYRVCGMTVLCYPLIFEVSEFYLYRDMALLIDDIKTELQFVGKFWRLSGRPTVCLLIREEHMRDPQFKEMLDLLAMLRKGHCDGLKVRIGRLQNLISSSCIEHLDFMNTVDTSEMSFRKFKQLEHEYIGYQSLTDVPRALQFAEPFVILSSFNSKPTWEILDNLRSTEGLHARSQLLGVLLKREGPDYEFAGTTVQEQLALLYHQAGCLRHWAAVRHCSSLLNFTVDSISPFITTVLVNGKQITVGVIGHEETVFDKPMTPKEIQSVMYNTIAPYDTIQAVLQQEVVLYCGRLIGTSPRLFSGILKIRVGWVLEAMKVYLKISTPAKGECKPLEHHSPSEVRLLLHKILSVREWAQQEKLTPLQLRRLEGCLCRVPSGFYRRVWDVVGRTGEGLRVCGRLLPRSPTLSNVTRSEINFALLVEQMLNSIHRPEYRQIVVELLCIVSTILQRNPELTFRSTLEVDQLVSEANTMYQKDNGVEKVDDMTSFFSAPYSTTTGYLARAIVNNILQGKGELSAVSDCENSLDGEFCRIS